MLLDILFFVIAGAIVFAAYKLIFKKKTQPTAQKKEEPVEQPAQPEPRVVERENRNAANPANIRQRFVRNQNVNLVEEEERKEEEKEEEELNPEEMRKQQMKEAKKQAQREQREAFQHQLEAKEKKDAEKRSKYEERERQREEEEAKREELIRQLEEEQKKKEEEEYAKWKDMFTVEEVGKETEKVDEENLLQKFVDYINLRKVVMLDDLATEFKLNTKDVVDRIQRLLDSKKLSGIIDDRGKFIMITEDEFKAVMNFIKRRGRISRTDLVLECNRLIRMNPTEEDKEKLKKEEASMLKQLESDMKAMEEQPVT